ncbi:MAG: Mur ligase family protein [Patescibacteria group bacterium]|nr:Mur ligase family protein [Patescibacteria group bacterium]
MRFTSYQQGLNFFDSLKKRKRRGSVYSRVGQERLSIFLSFFDSPQNELKVIHVAGTSGKSSTCYLLSRLLSAHGFKVGLHLSPHFLDIRERFQINNQLLPEKKVLDYLNELVSLLGNQQKKLIGQLSWFETLVALAFYIFSREKVDFAVVEVGVGGWFDATNVVDRQDKLSLITKIGFDHTHLLGKTLEKIAFHKAMIINQKSQALVISQEREVLETIKKVARQRQAKLIVVFPLPITVSLVGEHQKENATLALEALRFLSKREKFSIDSQRVSQVFQTVSFLGRFDVRKINGRTLVIDGAHSQPKMAAFIKALTSKFPQTQFDFLISIKKKKDYQGILEMILPWANRIVLIDLFSSGGKRLSYPKEQLSSFLEQKNFFNYRLFSSLESAFDFLRENGENILVVTGSLHLVAKIYQLLKIDLSNASSGVPVS